MLQEAGSPPGDLAHLVPVGDDIFWNRSSYDRRRLVVPLSDRVRVERFRQRPPVSELGERDIGVSGNPEAARARLPDAFLAETTDWIPAFERVKKSEDTTNSSSFPRKSA